jgi:hypothetical protein
VPTPFDISKPDTRPVPLTFTTDEATLLWLDGMAQETTLSRSLIIHRILNQARESVGIATVEGERRQGDRRSA